MTFMNAPVSITIIFFDRMLLFEFFLDYWNVKNTNIYIEHDA